MCVLVLPVHNYKRSVVYILSSIINDKWSLTVLSFFSEPSSEFDDVSTLYLWSDLLAQCFYFFHEWLGLVTVVNHAAPLDVLRKGLIMFELSCTYTRSPITLAG